MTYGSTGAITYSTWDPLKKSSGATLSNGNLTATMGSATGMFLSTVGISSGKKYWEVALGNNPSASQIPGIAKVQASYANWCGQTATSYGVDNFNGSLFNGGGVALAGVYPAQGYPTGGVTFGIALDMDNGKLYIRDSTGWYGGGTPGTAVVTGLTGTYYAAGGYQFDAQTANFGASTFAYPVPAGFDPGLY